MKVPLPADANPYARAAVPPKTAARSAPDNPAVSFSAAMITWS